MAVKIFDSTKRSNCPHLQLHIPWLDPALGAHQSVEEQADDAGATKWSIAIPLMNKLLGIVPLMVA